MDREFEAKYHRVEEHQWWCKARRDIVFRFAGKAAPNLDSRILEIGCSSGLLMLALRDAGYSDVTGIDVSDTAIEAARRRGLQNVARMDAARLDFPDAAFDLVIASDVLEHIPHDGAALREWRRVLRPGGELVLFVPAHQSLWSRHDEVNQHQRRYQAAELRRLTEDAGFRVHRTSSWNCLLTIPAFALAWLRRIGIATPLNDQTGGLVAPPPIINHSLTALLLLENQLLRKRNFPFGTSLFVLAQRA